MNDGIHGDLDVEPAVLCGGGILTGNAIREAVSNGDIVIDPWNPTHLHDEDRLNPASYDLYLGDQVAVYERATVLDKYSRYPGPVDGRELYPIECVLDVREPQPVRTFFINPEVGWVLKPGIGYLMHTHERILTKKYVPVLDGKSSLGRLFITAHVTAGYGDAGFNGQYTLEVVALTHGARVFPNMLFCQMRFHTQVGEPMEYGKKGNYVGVAAQGPVPSMIHKSFRKSP